jgi:hypothetical protein
MHADWRFRVRSSESKMGEPSFFGAGINIKRVQSEGVLGFYL